MDWSFCIVPGDERQEYLAHELKKAGKRVVSLTAPGENRAVVLQPGKSDDGSLLDAMGNGDILFGCADEDAADAAKQRGIRIVDLMELEPFALQNAMITAEGALMLAIERTADTLSGSRLLLAGYGRVGSLLARRLLALGARVQAVSTCKIERAQAEADGMLSADLADIGELIGDADLVINTIPAPILPFELLYRLKEGASVIDLASSPGCSPPDCRVLRASGLPGKTAPRAAARAMMQNILATLDLGR